MSRNHENSDDVEGESATQQVSQPNYTAGEQFDGLRPKNAVCLQCGYLLGGVPIEGGAVVCPECGHENRFELPTVKGKKWPGRVGLTFRTLGFATQLVALAFAYQHGGWKWVIFILAAMLLFMWALKKFVTWFVEG